MPALGGVIDIVEAEADDLAGILDRRPEAQAAKRPAGVGRRAARRLLGGGEAGIARAYQALEVARQLGCHARQIDDALALQHADLRLAALVEGYQPHRRLLT